MHIVTVGPYKVGPGQPLLLLAGPCVLEGYEHSLAIGREVKRICTRPMCLRRILIKPTVLRMIHSGDPDWKRVWHNWPPSKRN